MCSHNLNSLSSGSGAKYFSTISGVTPSSVSGFQRGDWSLSTNKARTPLNFDWISIWTCQNFAYLYYYAFI